MSIAPFAALEGRVNSAVFARLSNAQVSIAGAPVFGGIFDDESVVGGVGPIGMATSQPCVSVPAGMVPSSPVGMPIAVNGVAYLIAASRPDGVGGVMLMLELP